MQNFKQVIEPEVSLAFNFIINFKTILQGFKFANRTVYIRRLIMHNTSDELNEFITNALNAHSDMVRRICFLYLKNYSDVDDVFQEVFLSLLKNRDKLENAEHEKAWIIKVTINKCKDLLKSYWYRNVGSLDDIDLPFETKEQHELMQVVLSIPPKYKEVIYLYYYQDYSVPEIANMLKKNENTIYSQLNRARNLIKEKIGGTEYEYNF